MASNLRVDSIVPSTGTNVAIGTAGGGVNILGVLTYEDVTNVDSVGVITARDGLRVTGITTITSGSIQINAGGNTTQAIFSGNGGSGSRGLSIVTESVGAQDEGVILNARASGTTGRIKLQTNSTTALTIDGTGSNGNITANTGNIIIGTAGKGIDFSAQTATSATGATTTGETLVHYEEGTWTATLYGNSTRTNVDTTTSTTSRAVTGTYRKIGSLVYVQALWTGLHNGGGNDMFNHQLQRIEGLPFPSSNASGTSKFTSALGYNRGIYAAYGSNVHNDCIFYFFLGTNSSTVYPQASLVLQNSPTTLFHITSNTTSDIYYAFQMTYHTN